jgi:formamidopyrimidine-DNA glycosylase
MRIGTRMTVILIMPELPEVETVRMQLEKRIIGFVIKKITAINQKSLIGNPKLVVGEKIIGAERFGKMLVLKIAGNFDIGIHLKMSGQLIYSSSEESLTSREVSDVSSRIYSNNILQNKHTRVIIEFTNGSKLFFNDQRKFGWVRIMNDDELSNLQFIKKLGKEPWDITDADFYKLIHHRNRSIKLVILDQEIISGVGNIYANDALWEAGIKPTHKASIITKKEAHEIRINIIKVLKEGIKFGGSTGQDGKYVNLEGSPGGYQNHFRVYDKKGQKCLRKDGGVIEKITLGGRGTYYCPVCQK